MRLFGSPDQLQAIQAEIDKHALFKAASEKSPAEKEVSDTALWTQWLQQYRYLQHRALLHDDSPGSLPVPNVQTLHSQAQRLSRVQLLLRLHTPQRHGSHKPEDCAAQPHCRLCDQAG